MLLVRLIRALNTYFDEGWRTIPFQPVLYLFLWGATFRLWIEPSTPLAFEEVLGNTSFYGIWLAIGIACPPMALLSWFLIQMVSGAWRLRGMWFRFAADIGVFVMILSYHITVVIVNPSNESRIFSRYVVAAAMVFVLGLIVRDAWALVINSIKARGIRRVRLQ